MEKKTQALTTLKKDEVMNCSFEEIKSHDLIRTKQKDLRNFKTLKLTYISFFFDWLSFNCCYSYRITISATGLKICVITAGIKKYKSIIKVEFFPSKKIFFTSTTAL